MSEFSGLWKHKNNPAVTARERKTVLHKKSDQYEEEEKKLLQNVGSGFMDDTSAFMGDTSVKRMGRENAKQHSRPNNCAVNSVKRGQAWQRPCSKTGQVQNVVSVCERTARVSPPASTAVKSLDTAGFTCVYRNPGVLLNGRCVCVCAGWGGCQLLTGMLLF